MTTTTPTEIPWTPPADGFSSTPNCPTCGHVITIGELPIGEAAHELGPCIGCGDELSARNDVMGLMVMGSAWRGLVDAAIAKELAARRKCPKCKRQIRVTAEGKLQVHLLAGALRDRILGDRCEGSGGDPA
jgi:hypothetical protein